MVILLDTSELRAKSKEDSSIKSLQRLAKDKHIQLLLPYVVEMEYKTQMTGAYSKPLSDFSQKLQELTPKNNSKLKRKFESHLKKNLAFIKSLLKDTENEVDKFFASLNPVRPEISQKLAKNVLEAYFNGTPPYKKVKSREDIPDAFLLESVKAYLNQKKTTIYIVTRDKKLGESFSSLGSDKVKVFSDSDELIAHPDFQARFANEFVHKNLYSIDQSLRANTAKLKDELYNELEEKIPFETFSRSEDYFETDDVTITSVTNIDKDNIQFNFKHITDYGGGEVVIPFYAEMDVLGDFYMHKFEYHRYDMDFLSVKEQNDHVYEVENEFSIKVSGLLTIDVDAPANSKGVFRASMIKYHSAKIDSSIEITVQD